MIVEMNFHIVCGVVVWTFLVFVLFCFCFLVWWYVCRGVVCVCVCVCVCVGGGGGGGCKYTRISQEQ